MLRPTAPRLSLALLCVLAFASLTTHAQRTGKRQFEVSEDGRSLATVTVSWTNVAGELTINRAGQPAHSYHAFLDLYATAVHIGGKKVLGVYTKEGRVDTRESSFHLREVRWSDRGQRSDVAALREQLAPDMRILRAIRAFDHSADTDLFELAFVIATADAGIRESPAPTSLQVRALGRARAGRGAGGVGVVTAGTVPR